MIKTYEQLRYFSDKSIPEAKKIIGQYLSESIIPSEEYDDMNNCTDLVYESRRIRIAHRCRTDKGMPMNDITIKSKSKHGKYRSNGERILTEYDKLQDLSFSDTDEEFYYFYCYLDADQKITKYVLFDLKKLCNTTEFLFDQVFEPEIKNGVDGGSSFRPIRISTLHRLDCILVDKSQGI